MKKTIIVLALGLLSVYSNATTIKRDIKKINPIQSIKKQLDLEREFSCTVTITGTVGYGSTNISVSCAATADDCDKASSQAVACVGSTIAAVKKAVKAIL
jgi:hypothetical protein